MAKTRSQSEPKSPTMNRILRSQTRQGGGSPLMQGYNFRHGGGSPLKSEYNFRQTASPVLKQVSPMKVKKRATPRRTRAHTPIKPEPEEEDEDTMSDIELDGESMISGLSEANDAHVANNGTVEDENGFKYNWSTFDKETGELLHRFLVHAPGRKRWSRRSPWEPGDPVGAPRGRSGSRKAEDSTEDSGLHLLELKEEPGQNMFANTGRIPMYARDMDFYKPEGAGEFGFSAIEDTNHETANAIREAISFRMPGTTQRVSKSPAMPMENISSKKKGKRRANEVDMSTDRKIFRGEDGNDMAVLFESEHGMILTRTPPLPESAVPTSPVFNSITVGTEDTTRKASLGNISRSPPQSRHVSNSLIDPAIRNDVPSLVQDVSNAFKQAQMKHTVDLLARQRALIDQRFPVLESPSNALFNPYAIGHGHPTDGYGSHRRVSNLQVAVYDGPADDAEEGAEKGEDAAMSGDGEELMFRY